MLLQSCSKFLIISILYGRTGGNFISWIVTLFMHYTDNYTFRFFLINISATFFLTLLRKGIDNFTLIFLVLGIVFSMKFELYFPFFVA